MHERRWQRQFLGVLGEFVDSRDNLGTSVDGSCNFWGVWAQSSTAAAIFGQIWANALTAGIIWALASTAAVIWNNLDKCVDGSYNLGTSVDRRDNLGTNVIGSCNFWANLGECVDGSVNLCTIVDGRDNFWGFWANASTAGTIWAQTLTEAVIFGGFGHECQRQHQLVRIWANALTAAAIFWGFVRKQLLLRQFGRMRRRNGQLGRKRWMQHNRSV